MPVNAVFIVAYLNEEGYHFPYPKQEFYLNRDEAQAAADEFNDRIEKEPLAFGRYDVLELSAV